MEFDFSDLKRILEAIMNAAEYDDLKMYKNHYGTTQSIYKNVLSNYFHTKEGFSCSSDKGGYVASMMVKTLKDGKYYPLKETYREYQANGGDIGGITELDEVAFWCPKTMETTKDAFDIFMRCLANIDYDEINKGE